MKLQPSKTVVSRVSTGLLAAAAALTLAACSIAGADTTAVTAAAPPPDVSLFVASTRPDRGSDPVLPARHALVRIAIPANHQAGNIELPRYGAARRGRHFTVIGERKMSQSEFSAEIASHLSGRVGSDRDVLVFVHGFNTSLDEARFRLAQIVADGRFGGVAVLFTWPSANQLLAYESDKQAATISRDALTQLLRELAHAPGAGRIHLLAHSMGAWLSMESLRELAIGGEQRMNGRAGEVMLAAPDIDMGVFRQQMARIGNGIRVSVFASRGDRALHLSARIAGARPRVGALDASRESDRRQLAQLGVRVYDISAFSSGFIGHDNYANAPAVVRTIGAELTRTRPEDRDKTAIIDGGVARAPQAPFIPAPVESAPLPEIAPGGVSE